MSAAEEPRRRGLGRGLSALLGEPVPVAAPVAGPGAGDGGLAKGLKAIPIERLSPGRFQPRKSFDQAAIDDLVDSVREKGILQPILARRHPETPDSFEIIAGERRWRAAQAAGLHEIPVLVQDLSDREALEVGLVENLQRQDLSPLEEAEGYQRLLDEFNHTQEALAKTVGKSRSHVANMMRLLALPAPVKAMLEDGRISAGHARALLTSSDPHALAEQVVAKGLNVRQTEKLASKKPDPAPVRTMVARDPDLLALERDLAQILGLKVAIRHGQQGGEVSIHYMTLEQLDEILHRLSNGLHGRSSETLQ